MSTALALLRFSATSLAFSHEFIFSKELYPLPSTTAMVLDRSLGNGLVELNVKQLPYTLSPDSDLPYI
ncbi:MAG: hypothetical protein AAGJ55_01475, partial [Cyanobacteria bacterium J06555_12]